MRVKDDHKQRKEDQYYIDLLKDPQLLDRIVLDGLDHKIAGESIPRKIVFICAMGAFVCNSNRTSYNLLVNSESGAGKDHLVRNVLKVFDKGVEDEKEKKIHYRSRISPMALTYWHNSVYEPNWTWNGKILYLEDVSNDILNSDVFKVFTSSGSYATIVKDQRAIDIKINGKPVVIITSASAEPASELLRRFMVINLTETRDQTEEIMGLIEQGAKNPEKEEEENHFHHALKYIKPVSVMVPFAKDINRYFPKDNIITRTNYSRFFDFIKASAVLHQFARERRTDGNIVASGDDYMNARMILHYISASSDLVPLTRSQQDIIDTLKELGMNIVGDGLAEKEIGWSIPELLSKLPLSRAQVYREIKVLTKLKFIKVDPYKGQYDKRHYNVYSYCKQKCFKLPDWEKIQEDKK